MFVKLNLQDKNKNKNKNRRVVLKKRVFFKNFEFRVVNDFFVGAILSHLFYYPVPSNLNYWASVRI